MIYVAPPNRGPSAEWRPRGYWIDTMPVSVFDFSIALKAGLDPLPFGINPKYIGKKDKKQTEHDHLITQPFLNDEQRNAFANWAGKKIATYLEKVEAEHAANILIDWSHSSLYCARSA